MTAVVERARRAFAQLPGWSWPVLLLAALVAVPFTQPARIVQLAILFGVNALLAQSINLLTGYTGQISLGHAAIYGAGAYGTAVLAVRWDWPVWASVPAGIMLALLIGGVVSIPAGRVREFYLAMVTLGLGLLGVELIKQWSQVTGGFSGLGGIPSPALLNLEVAGVGIDLVGYYYLVLLVVAVVTWLLANVITSHIGRSLVAVHANEITAATLGVNPGSRKRLAYLLSAGLAGVAGVLYAHLVGYVSPDAFSVHVSIAILVFAVLGGMRTLAGPFLGAALLTYLPDQLQAISEHQHLVYGMVLLLSFIVLPRGIAGLLPYRTPLIRAGRARREEPDQQPAPPPDPAPRDGVLLEVRDVVQTFAGVRALDGVSMSVRAGSIHGLIGPNGSGKTTLLNVVSGIYAPRAGSVSFAGEQISGAPAHAIARRGVSRTFQHPLVFDELTVRENVLAGAERLYRYGLFPSMLRAPRAAAEERRLVRLAEETIDRVGLTELSDSLAGGLPFGRKRMLELARSVCARPRLLMLDEPAAGLAEADLEDLARLLGELRDDGMTIIVIEHHMDFLLGLADTVTVLDYGQAIFTGDSKAVRHDERVIEAYLGKTATSAPVEV